MSSNDAGKPRLLPCQMCGDLFAPDELTFHYGMRLCDDCLDAEGYEMWPDHEFPPPGMSQN